MADLSEVTCPKCELKVLRKCGPSCPIPNRDHATPPAATPAAPGEKDDALRHAVLAMNHAQGGNKGGLAEAIDECRAALSNPAPVAAPAPASEAVAWLSMETAPKDGTLLRLLVNFEHHATEDGEGPQPTIGSNTWDNHHDFDEWLFAGWNWEQDCYTQGVGTPVGWLPMVDDTAMSPVREEALQTLAAYVNNPPSGALPPKVADAIRIAIATPSTGVQQAVTLTWVEGGFDKRICHDADGKVRGQIERSMLHGRWAAVADVSIGEYMTEAQAKSAVSRAALKGEQPVEPSGGERGEV